MATEWYYLKNGEKVGPISSTELKNLAVKQEIMPSDLIWKEGLEKWVAAKSVDNLIENDGIVIDTSYIDIKKGGEKTNELTHKIKGIKDRISLRIKLLRLSHLTLPSLYKKIGEVLYNSKIGRKEFPSKSAEIDAINQRLESLNRKKDNELDDLKKSGLLHKCKSIVKLASIVLISKKNELQKSSILKAIGSSSYRNSMKNDHEDLVGVTKLIKECISQKETCELMIAENSGSHQYSWITSKWAIASICLICVSAALLIPNETALTTVSLSSNTNKDEQDPDNSDADENGKKVIGNLKDMREAVYKGLRFANIEKEETVDTVKLSKDFAPDRTNKYRNVEYDSLKIFASKTKAEQFTSLGGEFADIVTETIKKCKYLETDGQPKNVYEVNSRNLNPILRVNALPGDEWQWESYGGFDEKTLFRLSYKYKKHVKCYGYDCVLIQMTSVTKEGQLLGTIDTWFAKGLGIVKQSTYVYPPGKGKSLQYVEYLID
jgi:hypothetical protein